jgi:hypothetical protein
MTPQTATINWPAIAEESISGGHELTLSSHNSTNHCSFVRLDSFKNSFPSLASNPSASANWHTG